MGKLLTKLDFKGLYSKIVSHKFITICTIFTFITVLESLLIVFEVIPGKEGLGPYIHMVGRFVLNSIVVCSLYIFELLRKYFKSKLLVFLITYIITLGFLLVYIWFNNLLFKEEMHPDAYIYGSISYTSMYLLVGLVYFVSKYFWKNKSE
ncbi:MAG: hypothetical protein K0Q49_1564 [Haloplasmataceae bacterium]|jgi:hypothetical protein|nr:hypothetical protein [Haloplasmataceae bacterium]